ncbi:MAG: hypothetical protein IT287_08345 [Bdellovibrionaceae bacterium]|nr:hypothetical protein [Pseudobdellovibrionaceae bacterium]
MLSFKQTIKTLVGISALALVAGSIVSCGKKKSSGGTAATAPANCETGADCTVGQNYASGVYFRSAVGQANYGNSQNILAKLAFFGKTASGLNANSNPVVYNGAFDVTGTIRLADGRYYGVSSTATRMVSFFNLQVDFGLQVPSYTAGYSYWIPCGYNNPNCNGGGGYTPPPVTYPPTCPNQNTGGCNPNTGYGQCAIPVGDYTVTTITSGNYTSANTYGYNNDSFTNLKIRFTSGGNVVDATIAQGTLQPSQYTNGTTTASHLLRGRMVINTVNNQQCNQTVQF